jgi:hypothetical protein
MHASPTTVSVARWSAFVALTVVGLFMLNDAFFSAWVAGGPPGEHKLGWERRSLASLVFALALFCTAGAAFRAIPRIPQIGKVSWALFLVAALLAAVPLAAREVLINSCLDSGGAWNSNYLECSR